MPKHASLYIRRSRQEDVSKPNVQEARAKIRRKEKTTIQANFVNLLSL
jgi:hypothetical protein